MFGEPSRASWWSRTAEEIREVAQRDGSVLVLPVGSIEQHGRHLPVATDTILVDSVARLAADRVEADLPLLVAPPVWSGYSPHHLAFGGTLTLDFETLLAVLEELADSALENGFDALLLLNGHGGNMALVSGATSLIGRTHPESEVLGLTYFQLAQEFVDDIRESEPGGMAHGGEFETSLMLHLLPELVHEDRVGGEPLDEPYDLGLADLFEGGPLTVYRPFEVYSETGGIGRPELASAEKGRRLADRLAEELASLLTDIHRRNRTDGA